MNQLAVQTCRGSHLFTKMLRPVAMSLLAHVESSPAMLTVLPPVRPMTDRFWRAKSQIRTGDLEANKKEGIFESADFNFVSTSDNPVSRLTIIGSVSGVEGHTPYPD